MNTVQHDFIKDITEFIFVSDAPAPADILFIPGGSYPELPEYAAALYKEGYVPYLLPSGKYSIKNGSFAGVKSKREIYSGDYRTECDFMTDVLIKNGVPASAVITEPESEYTQQNAFFSRAVTDRLHMEIRSALIVCKAFHARRCLSYYSMAFPETKILICPVNTAGLTRDNWFLTEKGIDRVLGELARCGSQMNADIKQYLLK